MLKQRVNQRVSWANTFWDRRRSSGARTTRPNVAAAALAAIVALWMGPSQAQAGPESKKTPAATEVRLSGDRKATTFELTLTAGLTAEVFTLANPYRVVVDLPDLEFDLKTDAGQKGLGLISAFRYGLFAEHKARIVIDTTGPVEIASANMTRAQSKAINFAIVMKPIDAKAFGLGTGAARTAGAPHESKTTEAASATPKKKGKPVIVIDPGHGGIDPGAMGANNVPEKTIVLAVAKQLLATLKKTGAYEVKMTRTSDVFISLDKRLEFSAESDADLFISLHADSIKTSADIIRGATVYTLSEQASDEQARAMAEKENSSDLIAGLESAGGEENDQVKSILIDLMKRETSNFSADFSQVVAARLGKTIAMSRIPRRSAAFKVLKQTDAPSVLIELGYMSNAEDQKQMETEAWQAKVADALTAAVKFYFSKRKPSHP